MARIPLDNPLTPRQLEIVMLLADGHTPKAVAAKLGISRNTLDAHINTAAAKIPRRNIGALSALILWWRGAGREHLIGTKA